jgi:hypothetical protein
MGVLLFNLETRWAEKISVKRLNGRPKPQRDRVVSG